MTLKTPDSERMSDNGIGIGNKRLDFLLSEPPWVLLQVCDLYGTTRRIPLRPYTFRFSVDRNDGVPKTYKNERHFYGDLSNQGKGRTEPCMNRV